MNTIECAFEGRAAVTPELRTSANGVPWCRLSVAVGRGDELQWVSVVAYKEIAMHAVAVIEKGSICYVEQHFASNAAPSPRRAMRRPL
jgi:hypothetical protein